eukprot:m.137436 g.137436  ORF g.137436 m.137436 type:complete len:173 (+) comp38219_c0_seq27:33-551(+)
MDRWSRKQESRLSWTDDLSPSPATGLGVSANQRYHRDGNRSEVREMEDTSFHHQVGSDCLYGVFDGHEGRKVAEYARQRFPAELLLGQLEGVDDDERVVQALQNSFLQVERAYFSSIDGLVAEKAQLQLSLPQVRSARVNCRFWWAFGGRGRKCYLVELCENARKWLYFSLF